MTKKEAVVKVTDLENLITFLSENIESVFSLIEQVKKNPSMFEDYSGKPLEKMLEYVKSKIASDKLPTLGFFNGGNEEAVKYDENNQFGDL